MSTDNSSTLEIASQLAHRVCQAIATQYWQNSKWLADDIRQNAWQNPTYRRKVTDRLIARLSNLPNQGQFQACKELLECFFDITFFSTSEYQLLEADLVSIVGLKTASKQMDEPQKQDAIALLLLDAENLQLSLEQENFLAGFCDFPLQVKIAFADWRKLGKYDEELHQRNYDLMHVPKGKDMADGKMITVGSSLQERYPNIKEVLVCSSDKVMTSLCIRLHQQGLAVYQIRRQTDGTLGVLNGQTGRTEICPDFMLPSLEKAINQLQQIMWKKQNQTSQPWSQLSVILQEFKKETGYQISQIVNAHTPGKKVKDLFVDRADLFAVHQKPNQTEVLINVLMAPDLTQNNQISDKQNPTQQTIKNQPTVTMTGNTIQKVKLPFKNSEQLEAAIIAILETLEADSSGFCTISKVGSQFSQLYACPVTTAIKQLNLNKKYPTFLQSCPKLIVQKNGKEWAVKVCASKNKG
jgi:hypothetical protein